MAVCQQRTTAPLPVRVQVLAQVQVLVVRQEGKVLHSLGMALGSSGRTSHQLQVATFVVVFELRSDTLTHLRLGNATLAAQSSTSVVVKTVPAAWLE